MRNAPDGYLLTTGNEEVERLRLQAYSYQSEAEIMLDQIDVKKGWKCIDLGCGAVGILGPLSHRVGKNGKVIGVDVDTLQLSAAGDYIREMGLKNVNILARDARRTGLPRESFDLVHVRFLFAPLGHENQLLKEMFRLAKPGGIIAVEEPDSSSWNCYPPNKSWKELKKMIVTTFSLSGGDYNVGQRIFGMLRRAGLLDVRVRASVMALQDRHLLMSMPVKVANSLRKRLLENKLVDKIEFEKTLRAYQRTISNPLTFMTTSTLIQVWGRKPN